MKSKILVYKFKLPIIPFFLFLVFANQVFSQLNLPDGYPDRSPSMDVLPGFLNPPKGYGEVPFYWWQGDTLTRERLEWQLNELQDKGISSLQINYSHLDEGGISYGLSRPSEPALFTEAWWDLFRWFTTEAQKRGMTVSLSDYTLGIGQGFAMDEAIKEFPDMNGSVLKEVREVFNGKCSWQLPFGFVNVTAYKQNPDSSLDVETRKDLLPFVKEGQLIYDFNKENWQITCIYSNRIIPSYDPMHPESGRAYNRYFFDKIEKALPEETNKSLNFFFSDELNFRLSGNLWNKNFADEFRKRKGYDIVPFLDALFADIGAVTPKIRLDYNDVLVKLSEENFFIPVYEWHQSRGLIFGCDHGGRGRDVAEFGDYFRTQRWNQGPGSDQPNLSKDIIKAKVAASISHLYDRPRVWLEGFHSSGWGTSSANLTDAILANYVAGYNLMSFHGLYYSTHGGWWEWAPPDNHFRMPYWKQMNPLMDCIERLSYVLSQGHHVCDVAIIYPTEPVIAGVDGKESVNIAFKTGNMLYDKGIDFDFIDFESIARSETKNGELHVSGEKYKVVVIPSMKVIRHSTLKKLEEFKNAGGIIVNVGDIPEASDKNGAKDAAMSKLVSSVFSDSKNVVKCNSELAVAGAISKLYKPNFKVLNELEERPYIMHRLIGKRDVYALYNFPKGSKCFFKSKGNVQLWNPWNGNVSSLSKYTEETIDGTEITLPLSKSEIQLIVFCPEEVVQNSIIQELARPKSLKQIPVDRQWEFELQPSLDNQWGDFQLPATNEMMGAQLRQLHFQENKEYKGEKLTEDKNRTQITCGYGTRFLKLGPLAKLPNETDLLKIIPRNTSDSVKIHSNKYAWEVYDFSWQQGVEGDWGHQGWHGLKGEMYDNFIRLGAVKEEKHSKKRIMEVEGDYYLLYTTVLAPRDGEFELLTGDEKPTSLFVNKQKRDVNSKRIHFSKGVNSVMAVYSKACETYLVFRDLKIERPEKQPISMSWYNDYGILPFDCSSVTQAKTGLYTFESAPGLHSLTFDAYGKVTLWIDGKNVRLAVVNNYPDGLRSYKAKIKPSKTASSKVVIHVDYQPGYPGGAAFPHFIKQQCGISTITLGDWSKLDGLKSYSGGAWYRKKVKIESEDLKGKLVIDLGDVVSSAELIMNGKSAGIKLAPPWKFDVTKLAKAGTNKIEILVYNTLSNNYVAVPTRYQGELKSGMIGPVYIESLIY